MHIHLYERIVLGLTLAVLLLAGVAVANSVFAAHIHLPGPVARIDPALVRSTPPFDQPGVRQTGPHTYQAVILAQAWSYTPNIIEVPIGSTVAFVIASADVMHGFLIENTNVNLSLVPGEVAEASATFRERGSYLLVCHEYCGIGHQTMFGRVVVQ